MRIQYMSDLHMELYDNSRYIKAAIEREESKLVSIPEREQARPKVKAKEFDANGDVLVLAGDTFYLRDIIAPQKRFWNWASKNFRQVLMVPGNHEFYGNGDVTERGDSWQWMFFAEQSGKAERRENVGYYYNKVVRIDDIDFILTTLWSKIPEMDMFYVLRGMNDFHQIMYNGRRFMPEDFNLEHEKCIRLRYLDFQSSAYTTSAKVPLEEAKGFEPLGRFTALWFSRPVQ